MIFNHLSVKKIIIAIGIFSSICVNASDLKSLATTKAPKAVDTESLESLKAEILQRDLASKAPEAIKSNEPVQQEASLPQASLAENLKLQPPKLPSVRTILLKLAVLVCLVSLMGLIGRWLLKKEKFRKLVGARLPSGAPRAIEILARQPISPKQNLILLRVQTKTLLISSTPNGVGLVSEIASEDSGFDALLNQPTDSVQDQPLTGAQEESIRSRIKSRLEGLKPL
jgi:flagellar biogenesis protein FliO